MEAHEYASIFPMLPEAELNQLAEDIKTNGLNNPIIKLDGKILDGRNRFAACKIAGIRPVFDEYQGDDPLAFVFSQNFTRRQLSESQKGMIGARYATLSEGRPRETVSGDTVNGKSRKEAADMVGVGEATVGRARSILTHGAPELVSAVERGEVTVNAGAAVAKLPHEEQRAAVEAGPDAIREAAKRHAQNCGPTNAPFGASSSKRLPPLEINNADEIATQARVTLDRIMTKDKGRVAALQSIIDYCQNRISSNK
jgi:ParB-like chromosome segregation protein Spo0J